MHNAYNKNLVFQKIKLPNFLAKLLKNVFNMPTKNFVHFGLKKTDHKSLI